MLRDYSDTDIRTARLDYNVAFDAAWDLLRRGKRTLPETVLLLRKQYKEIAMVIARSYREEYS